LKGRLDPFAGFALNTAASTLEVQGGELFLIYNGIGLGTSVPELGTWAAAALLLLVALMHLRSRRLRSLPVRNQ
jgi:hypothetical protein